MALLLHASKCETFKQSVDAKDIILPTLVGRNPQDCSNAQTRSNIQEQQGRYIPLPLSHCKDTYIVSLSYTRTQWTFALIRTNTQQTSFVNMIPSWVTMTELGDIIGTSDLRNWTITVSTLTLCGWVHLHSRGLQDHTLQS